MAGYLTRLVSRGSATPSMAPVVRSASPIADADQRAGLYELDTVPLIDAPTAGTNDPGAQQPPAPPLRETESTGATAPTAFAPPAVRVRPPAPHATPRMAAVHPPNATDHTNVSGSAAAAPRHLDRGDRARPPIEPALDVTPAAFERSPRAAIGRTTGAAVDRTRRLPSADQRTGDARRVETPPPLEPLPRTTAAAPRMPAGSEEWTAEPDVPAGPRLTIGSINVEVVPAAPEPAPAPPARQGPITAASVSVIGPLSPRVRANRHSSLRYR